MQNPNFTLPPPPDTPTDDFTATNPSSSLFDWSDFLDFNIDDTLSFPDTQIPDTNFIHDDNPTILDFSSGPEHVQEHAVDLEPSGQRVRKRDPRLVCSNFMAGRIPCACPEMDAKLEEEEMLKALAPDKKKARVARVARGEGVLRCQVPECDVDISELKGYHKRHRVCLTCANAGCVVLDGESKRYCQQCGKFHILPDFDEGKRSCRRKLERHNNRRRRKPADGKGVTEKEQEHLLMAEDVSCDDDRGKEAVMNSQPVERDKLESELQPSELGPVHGSQMVQADCTLSYTASGEAPIDAEKGNLASSHSPTVNNRSPSDGDNRSAFSSVCPTGRISFKLYDWNPAEFPRRLRNQIFQWLASMPVELEGYIRPGCIIFTVFIAMPKPLWVKLAEDPVPCLHNFIISPRNILSGRGTMLVYLNNMIFHVTKDGTSVTEVKAREMAPRLHYVHPTCFVAGKPMEFVACGSNLLQSNLRFLFSFSGKYIACKSCVTFNDEIRDSGKRVDHQVVKVCVTETASDLLGPAFIEVENEFGLSNFIPVLIGNQEICAEIELMQQRFGTALTLKRHQLAATCSSCEVFVSQRLRLQQFILDVAWLLKEPLMEDLEFAPSINIQRFNHLTKFLIENESRSILARLLHRMKVLVDRNLLAGVSDGDMRLFCSNIDIAKDELSRRKLEHDSVMMAVNNLEDSSTEITCVATAQTSTKGLGEKEEPKAESRMDLSMLYSSEIVPLLDKNVSRSGNGAKVWQGRSSSRRFLTGTLFSTKRPAICVIAAVAVCLGVCVIFLHPQKVERIAATIRRCLLENSS